MNTPESMYSVGDLFVDLSAKYSRDRFAALRSDSTYAQCWKAICNILDAAVDKQRPVKLPGFGEVTYRIFNLGICIPHFHMNEKFLKRNGLAAEKQKIYQRDGKKLGPTIKINKQLGGQYAGFEPDIFGQAYERMLAKIEEVMSSGTTISLDFGVGTFYCENYKATFEFVHRLENKPGNDEALSMFPLENYGRGSATGGNKRLTTAASSSLLSNLPETSRRIKLGRVPKPPPQGSRRKSGRSNTDHPGTGRMLTDPSKASMVAMRFNTSRRPDGQRHGFKSQEHRMVPKRERKFRGKYPPLLDEYARTRCAVVEDIVYLRKIVDRIGSHYTQAARSVGFDADRGIIVVRKSDSKAPTASDGFTDMMLSPRAPVSSEDAANVLGRGFDANISHNANSGQGMPMMKVEEVRDGNYTGVDNFLGMSNSKVVEENVFSKNAELDAKNSELQGGDSLSIVREIMELKEMIWKTIEKVASKKQRALKSELEKHQRIASNKRNTNFTIKQYCQSLPEHRADYYDIRDIPDEDLPFLLSAHVRSLQCRVSMWDSLHTEALKRRRSKPAGVLSVENERSSWSDEIHTLLAIANESITSTNIEGQDLLLEELEHFRHETLFALQVAVSVVGKKLMKSKISKSKASFSPTRKSKNLLHLEKMSAKIQTENSGPSEHTVVFLDWINFHLDDMREELAERLSNFDVNCMNDDDQSVTSRLTRSIHAAQREQLVQAVKTVATRRQKKGETQQFEEKASSKTEKGKTVDDSAIEQSVERFCYYADHGVPDHLVPAIPEASLANILKMCKSPVTEKCLESEEAGQMLERIFMQVKSEYRHSVRRAILQYILKSPYEQYRLRIHKLPSFMLAPEYGWGAHRRLPFDPPLWNDIYTESFELLQDNLFTTAPQMVGVLNLWENVRSTFMVDLPQSDVEAQSQEWRPMTIEEFSTIQFQRINLVKTTIMDEWMPQVIEIFQEADKNGMFVNVPEITLKRFFNSVATLMSTKARELVVESLQLFVSFFERFAVDLQQASSEQEFVYSTDETAEQRCALLLEVIVEHPDGEYESEEESEYFEAIERPPARDSFLRFKTSRDEIHTKLLDIFDTMARSLNSLTRVEHRIGSLNFESNMDLMTVNLDDHDVGAMRHRLNEVLTTSMEPLESFLSCYDEFNFLINDRPKLKKYFEAKHTIEEYGVEIAKYRQMGQSLNEKLKGITCTRMVRLDCTVLNAYLYRTSETLAQRVLKHLAHETVKDSIRIKDEFKEIVEIINKRSGKSDQLVDAEAYMKKLSKETLPQKKKAIRAVKDKVDFMYEYKYDVDEAVLFPAGAIFAWGRDIRKHIKLARVDIAGDRKKLEEKFNDERNTFVDQVQELHDEVSELYKQGGFVDTRTGAIKAAGEMHAKVEEFKTRVATYEAKAVAINEEEERLGFSASSFPTLEEASLILEPYLLLWSTASRFQRSYAKWMKGPIYHLSYEETVKDADDIWRTVRKLSKSLSEDSEKCAKLASEIFERVSSFKEYYDLLSAICNTGLRTRHWSAMSAVIGFTLTPDDHTSFSKLLGQGIDKHVKQLMVCAESATKESSIEKNMKKMKEEWEGVEFGSKAYKDTGAYIVTGSSIDEVQMILDDQIMKTQTMSSSQFAKPFAKDMKEWEKYLMYMDSLLEAWLQVQGTWLYLEPIFTSEDIVRQMPEEAEQFSTVDGGWRLTMNQINESPGCRKVYKIDGLLQRLEEANSLLETIQKGLSDYLMVKRIHFPRFFFLSDDELLEILAETKDPTKVQPFLKKCFDGLNSIKFNEDGNVIAMGSAEKEEVALIQSVSPAEAQGAVEKWLLQLEDVMRLTVRHVVEKGIEDYPQKERIEWVQNWPGQVVLCVSQLYWTRYFEEGVKENGAKSLSDYTETLTGYIDDIVDLVRGKLTKMLRKTLSALIIMDVHARDTVAILRDQKVGKTSDFGWQSQLRYYWEEGTLHVRMIVSDLEYGYEYLGNSGRLVITPLTDRCYRTLMGAIHLQYGGAPEGPAGTGKTETTKDLSKALARQCVVYNCSDGLDYLAMAKFFKGLASAGAWACFDEFNRIVLEVLSVVAQQITTIQQAVAAKKNSFVFYGTELTLKWTCNVFITMNPGYAGRAELPDNLKSLFRTVAMMVPDYAMIAEIILYSFGFRNSRDLATKIVTTFTLCSEQLSSQSHYDYGMRAVMSVLRAAGNLKQAFPDESEDVVALRAINDVNKAKFLSQDLDLFAGITSDLFPGVQLPTPDYTDLMESINENIAARNLQPDEAFIEKIIQTYEMMVVRHGFMIVGKASGGKTACLKVLASSLNDLCKRGKMPCSLNPQHELETEITTINPKSISMDRLYGCFDDITHEWSDGVLAIYYRAFASSTKATRKWTLFDGPVDAIWIENMNTVLDDNKKLCLMTGEMLQMNETMSMIFETLDLDAASPATVSRCGMVYLEPENIGMETRLVSWMNTLPAFLSKDEGFRKVLKQMFTWLIPPCIHFIFRVQKGKLMVPMEHTMLVQTVMSLAANLMDEFDSSREDNVTERLDQKKVNSWIESIVIFSIVWSFGGILNAAGREKFDSFIRSLIKGENASYPRQRKIHTPLPRQGSVFDCVWDKSDQGKWQQWQDLIDKKFEIPKTARVSEIVIPTIDTVRYTYLLNRAIDHQEHLLFVGPTGTGKTIYVNAKIMKDLDRSKFKVISLGFSAQTSSAATQSIIDSKLDKRRKNVYGPPVNKRCIIFIDDLNMPMVETYGAQPPLELIRQAITDGGWYDSKTSAFRNIVDTMFISAMGPPGGGRNHITPRILTRFQVFGMTPLSSSVMERIFGTIMDWHLGNGYAQELKAAAWPIVKATSHIYDSAMSSLLPTPSKSHYTFNLRDFARVIFGMTMVGPKEFGKDKNKITRLWTHEVLRVFSDRLVNDEDRTKLLEMARTSADRHLSAATGGNFDKCLKMYDINKDGKVNTIDESRQIIYGDFMNPKAASSLYDEVPVDAESVMGVMTAYLDDYNAMSTKPMNLVMFMFAVEHTARISRVLKTPGGHALLVGVGGSGRQSLTRLAAFIGDYELKQIEISKGYGVGEFQEDLKSVMIAAGGEGQPSVFLLSDTQITDETFVENISSLLNTGDVPNIYAADELGAIMELVRKAAAKEKRKDLQTTEDFYGYFVDRIKRYLHVVLAFSPIGDTFRERLRKFPSLVNCCTIDWFSVWPDDALMATANSFLQDSQIDEKNSAVQMCMHFHSSTVTMSALFLKQLKRHYHVTPTSYLSLITTFKEMLLWKNNEVSSAKMRYEVGLEKIETTEKSVGIMQEELEELQPQLIQTAKETAEMMIVVEKETADAQVIRETVAADEAKAAEQAKGAQAIKSECEADLAEAMPILEKALKALNTLSKNDITEVKAMKSPPAGVLLTMEAVCHMMGVKPNKSRDDRGKVQWDYWEPAKKELLGDTKFLQRLIDYDKDNIEEKIVNKVKPFVAKPEFMPDVVKKASVAAHGLCCWVRAMVSYDRVAKVVKPKKIALKQAEDDLEVVMKGLRLKQAELQAVEDKLDALDQELKRMEQKKEDLEENARLCVEKIDRAEKLLGGLGGEKARWKQYAIDLGEQLGRVVGDMLIASASIAYSGAFTAAFRQKITKNWLQQMDILNISYSTEGEKGYSLVSTIGDPVKIRSWNISGLPVDSFSVENGLIMSRSSRWPLMIDPQGQANKWIRNLEKENQLKVIKLSEENYLRTLEAAIQFGHPVLLENIGESLDASLEPLLLRQVFKSGGVNCLRLGDKTVEYSEKFRFFMTTMLANPHYLPETSVKVTIINFMITAEGLQDQLLGIVVAKEKPELEEQKNQLIIEGAENKRKLKEIEDKILHILSSSEGNILEDSAAIDVLTVSKTISDEISEKQTIAEQTEVRIDLAREVYIPVAVRSTILFFVVSSLSVVEPMYQYSLTWFNNQFVTSIADSEQSKNIRERIFKLNEYFTYAIYRNVCQSLFEKDKLLFSFLLTTKIVKNLYDAIEAAKAEKMRRELEQKMREEEEERQAAEDLEAEANGEPAPVRLPRTVKPKQKRKTVKMHALRGEKVTRITDLEEQFLLAGSTAGGDDSLPENPCPEWLRVGSWRDICYLSNLLKKSGVEEDLSETFVDLQLEWREMYDALTPETMEAPGLWGSGLVTPFQFLCLLRCIRPDRLVPAMTRFVAAYRGDKYTEPPAFDLASTFKDSSNLTPLVFILSPGTDPIGAITTFSAVSNRRLDSLSLGQGQGPIAERMMKEAMIEGSWVVLQNCHLFPSWMPRLDEIVENMQPKLTHQNFRLWLTSYPSNDFPVAILRNGVKLTNEPPKGIRANLLGSLSMEPISQQEFFEGCLQSRSFKKMVFGLCFFHAIVQERCEFGPIGWNIPYEFTASDLIISVRQLRFFLDDTDSDGKVPFEALQYIIGQCNYGGRVTDDKDRRAITSILANYFNSSILRDASVFSPSGIYYAPADGSMSDFIEYVQSLPLRAAPEVFGLHENANIAKDEQETNKSLATLLHIRATSGTTASADDESDGAETVSAEATIYMVAEATLAKMKPLYDMYAAQKKFKITWENSMNTVLVQELERFNKLNAVITDSLSNVMKAVKGVVVMSKQLEEVADGLLYNKTPKMWLDASYPSLCPMGSYVADFLKRLDFFDEWLSNGAPPSFWISGFYFTQAFLTGTMQNYARKHTIPIDALQYDFEPLDQPWNEYKDGPEDGAYVYGLFFDGAKWDFDEKCVTYSEPKKLYSEAPAIWFKPIRGSDRVQKQVYSCPVYKTSERRGTLSTTGHSTNFVIMIDMPTNCNPSTWIQAGVAMLTQLDD